MSVVIIGGGIAGLKAAQDLHERGVKFTLIEARDRLGGRMHTVTSDAGHSYDLGASWFHDSLVNTLFHEEVEAGAKFVFDYNTSRFMTEDGTQPPQAVKVIWDEINTFISVEYHEKLDAPDMSLAEMIMKYLKEKRKFLTRQQIELVGQMAREMEIWHGISWDQLSAKQTIIEHGGRCALATNYDQTWKRIADKLPQECIYMGKIVNKVSRDRNGVTVTTSTGDIFTGSHCIVTVPHNVVLSEPGDVGYIEHEPPLPRDFVEQISRIHFSCLGKIILEFKECTWSKDFQETMVMATGPEGFYDSVMKGEPMIGEYDVTKPWQYATEWVNLAAITGTPAFMVLTPDPLTSYIENLSSQEVWEYIKPVFEKVAGCEATPSSIITSKWKQDPFSRGSYTACHPNDDPVDAWVAYERGLGRVRFAGEHTSSESSGTVWGAWMSGTREANHILEELNIPALEKLSI